MKKYLKYFVFLFLAGLLTFSACNKEKTEQKVVSERKNIERRVNILEENKIVQAEEKTEEQENLEKENIINEDSSEEDYEVSDNGIIKPSETFACLGVNDQLITDYRAGLFVAGSLPLVDLYEPSITSKVEFTENGEYFDVIFNYYKEGDKLIAQYECPKAIKGNTFIDHVNDDDYRKECYIEEKDGKYISSDGCYPRFYCQGPNVKLKIFDNFLNTKGPDSKVIKIFKIKGNNPCKNASKLLEELGEENLDNIKGLIDKTDINIATHTTYDDEIDDVWELNLISSLDRPLLNTIRSHQTGIAKFLLEKEADPNLPNIEPINKAFVSEETFDALGWALKKSEYELYDLILPKMKTKKGDLVVASCYGNNRIVKEILEEDASAIDERGWVEETSYTPLTCALSHYNNEVAKTLVTYGANVNQPDPSGQDPMYCTPLQLAVYTNDLKIVKFLIDNGADVNLIVREIHGRSISGYCKSALEIAEKKRNKEMEKLLLDAGATFEGKIVEIDVSETKDRYGAIIEFFKSYKTKKP